MALPTITEGGAAIAITTTTFGTPTGTTAAAYNCFSLWEGTGQVIPDTAIPAAGSSVTVNGFTFSSATGSGSSFTITVQAASGSSVSPYIGAYLLSNQGGPAYRAVTVAGPSGSGTSYPAVTATQSATITESAAHGSKGLAAKTALTATALLMQSALAGVITHGSAPTTFAPRVAVNGLLGSETAARGAQSFGKRVALQSLLGESVPSTAHTLPAISLSETPLTEVATVRPRTFVLRSLTEGVLITAAARTGRAAPGGSTAPPLVSFEPALLTQAASRGVLTFARRSAMSTLFTSSAPKQPFSFALRTLLQSVLLTGLAKAPAQVTAAISPGSVDSRDPFVILAAELRYLLSLQGNPMSTASVNLAVFDKIAASYRINELTQMANTLAQLPTLIRGGDGTTSTVYGYGADNPILIMLPAADSTIAQAVPSQIIAGVYRSLMAGASKMASSLGFTSLDLYLTSLNTPAPFQALVHPNFALINFLYLNGSGTQLLSPGNVFAPQTAFGMGIITAAGTVSYTDLNAIPVANAINPTAGLSTQGYTAAKGVTANITTTINGTATVTLTASGQNAAGAQVAGRTWTAVITSLAAGASIAFTPAIAGDRISDVTAISVAGAATAGAFTLNSVMERIVS